ncbi:hypothetical protein ACIQ6K_14125 [Streptomyces sp. NPDC096354]|uniref:hypothetical protein n=1 Tax=Streptomyces sp. NPDC096354 TaxID=3366088 RepID=UPI0037F61551
MDAKPVTSRASAGGAKDAVIMLTDVVEPLSKAPTRMLNGYVHLATDPDPEHLRIWADAPRTKIGGNRAILFTWWQREAQAEFMTALEAAGVRCARRMSPVCGSGPVRQRPRPSR